MHSDLASSTEIFMDIVSQNIPDIAWDKKYFWIDLGSWSWLLTIAQYIQARRNGFRHIENIWVEIKKNQVEQSNQLLSTLWLWCVV
jgi:hypothetical protein